MDPFNRDMGSQDKGARIMGPGVEGGGEGGTWMVVQMRLR